MQSNSAQLHIHIRICWALWSFPQLRYDAKLILHSYSCNGRCGAGCSGAALGNAYTLDCFSHDVCSWFNNASGGARYVTLSYVHYPMFSVLWKYVVCVWEGADRECSDPNCGAAFSAAVDDTVFGVGSGCGQTNPSLQAVAPGGGPVCS